MTLHGVIDSRFTAGTQLKSFSEWYITVTRFLTSSFAQQNGIQRIAYHTGSTTGGGSGYWDETTPISSNAWSCYKFLSATIPFYLLVQYNDQNNPNTTPAIPAALDSSTSTSGVGFSFAQRIDSGSPWAGTTFNNGQDSKGAPVWTAGSGSSQLYVWPRSNSISGTFSVNREDMMCIPLSKSVTGYGYGSRCHFVCDFDNVFITGDDGGTGAYCSLYFGKYAPVSGSGARNSYVCLKTQTTSDDPHFRFATFGPATGTQNSYNGGIAHPLEPMSGTRAGILGGVNSFFALQFVPNQASSPGTYDEWPMYVGLNEKPHYGFAGVVDWIRFIYGVWSLETNRDKTRCFVGSAALNSAKISFPWDGATSPGESMSRTGTMF